MKKAAGVPGRAASKTSRPGKGAGAVPRGCHTVTPSRAVRDAAAVIDFDARALGAAPLPAGGGHARR
jgi:hypothetical protein